MGHSAQYYVQQSITESGLPIVLASIKTATTTLNLSLPVWIQNQQTMSGYPDTEDKSQSLALNAMRIEAGIAFLHNPLRK